MANKIDVFISVSSFQEEDVKDKTVVVIDVLRACSTMITALDNGAAKIIPVEDMDAAGRIAQTLERSEKLLCGEKDGVKIEGYDLGNSPLEYTRDVVEEKTIILKSTNGTKAVKKADSADQLIIGSFLNMKQVVEFLKSTEGEIILVCAGWHGRLSLEDMLCAGNIIVELYGGQLPAFVSDSARVAFELYEKYSDDIGKVIKQSDHARRLQDIVSAEEIEHCYSRDITHVLPLLHDGIITNDNAEEV